MEMFQPPSIAGGYVPVGSQRFHMLQFGNSKYVLVDHNGDFECMISRGVKNSNED
jgi:hypothetical protein